MINGWCFLTSFTIHGIVENKNTSTCTGKSNLFLNLVLELTLSSKVCMKVVQNMCILLSALLSVSHAQLVSTLSSQLRCKQIFFAECLYFLSPLPKSSIYWNFIQVWNVDQLLMFFLLGYIGKKWVVLWKCNE